MHRKLAVPVVSLLVLLPRALAAQAGGSAASHHAVAESSVDAERLLADLRYLAADERAGRRTGSPGNAAARAYLRAEFRRLGLEAPGGSHTQAFDFVGRRDSVAYRGINLLGLVRGTSHPDRYMVITAHYDHVGVGRPDATGDSIYNGADDNASGTAALLALAAYFRAHPPANSILFAALDAEEMGLQGARALVKSPPVPLESIVVNVNMDMVGRNARGELYVAGTHPYPFLKPYVDRVGARAGVKLLLGHDRPDLPPGDDWTGASDHGAFHEAGIPFLYFGVEDHPDYHKPSDEAEGIEPGFYARAVATVLDAVRVLDAELGAVAAAGRRAEGPAPPAVLPTLYAEHRFLVRPVTPAGDTLTLFTDTGGGLFLFSDVAARLGLPVEVVGVQGTDTVRAAPFPTFGPRASIPAPLGAPGGRIPIMSAASRTAFFTGQDGMLGQAWFADRVWTFDYPGRRLLLRASGDLPPHDPANRASLGFKDSPDGSRALSFPRIRVEIDGDSLDLLFDTGASTHLTDAALAAVGDGGGASRATSFITASLFERWRGRHPDWRVIEGAEQGTGAAMIEVPRVRVAGHDVGPVWFTMRPDRNFHEYMSQWMDRRVEGALGGSALRYFRVTVDYPNAVAVFERAGR